MLVKLGLADPLTLYVAHCGKWRETSTYQRAADNAVKGNWGNHLRNP